MENHRLIFKKLKTSICNQQIKIPVKKYGFHKALQFENNIGILGFFKKTENKMAEIKNLIVALVLQ